jgi:hypothetical protein
VTGSQISAANYGTISLANVPVAAGVFIHVFNDTGTLMLKQWSTNGMIPNGSWKAGKPGRPAIIETVA